MNKSSTLCSKSVYVMGKKFASYFRYRIEKISKYVDVGNLTVEYGKGEDKKEPSRGYTRTGGIWVNNTWFKRYAYFYVYACIFVTVFMYIYIYNCMCMFASAYISELFLLNM